jgi:ABC-type lipoprotein release transport system permease subunit
MNAAVEPLRGFPVEFRLSPGLVLGCLGVALLIAVAAGLVPAWRAARLPVVTALPRD